MKERKFIIIAILVTGVVALLLGGYYFWNTGKEAEVQQKDLLPVYLEYRDTPVTVATNYYTESGFERASFVLASPEKGVMVVVNDDTGQSMSLEIVEGPGEGYPKVLPVAPVGGHIEVNLEETGRYLIRDVARPEVYFTVELYSSVEEAKAAARD